MIIHEILHVLKWLHGCITQFMSANFREKSHVFLYHLYLSVLSQALREKLCRFSEPYFALSLQHAWFIKETSLEVLYNPTLFPSFTPSYLWDFVFRFLFFSLVITCYFTVFSLPYLIESIKTNHLSPANFWIPASVSGDLRSGRKRKGRIRMKTYIKRTKRKVARVICRAEIIIDCEYWWSC
jgi:hypothetical protein